MPRVAHALMALALLNFAGCVPAEESNDVMTTYPARTVMGAIQRSGELRVGLPIDSEPWAIEGGEPSGFLVDLAELVAASFGVEPTYSFADSDELLAALEVTDQEIADDPGVPEVTDTEVDLAFPLAPITEDLVKTQPITDPYWVGHTRTLRLDAQAVRVISTGPDVALVIEAHQRPGTVITGPQDSTEGYGAAVRTGATAFATIVSQVFNEADAEGDWTAAYEEWLADYFALSEPPVPIMTVEDAAALYPTELT